MIEKAINDGILVNFDHLSISERIIKECMWCGGNGGNSHVHSLRQRRDGVISFSSFAAIRIKRDEDEIELFEKSDRG